MTGFLASDDLTPNPIEVARRRRLAQGGYIDLTSSNPTHHGHLFPAAVLSQAAGAYWATRRYEPDARGAWAAREAVAQYYAGRTPACSIPPEQIAITASTSEAYSLLLALHTNPGDNILTPAVGYPLLEYLAGIHRVELRPYALDERRGWQIDPASLRAQADGRTRLVLVISPHNPTGMVVRAALPTLTRLQLPVVCDEVFAEFGYGVDHVPPFAALHPELPVFMLNGISKMFALPDLKLGWIACNAPAHQQYGERLEILNDMYLSSSGLIQAMLPAIMRDGSTFVGQMRRHIRHNIRVALELLAASRHVAVRPPDGGYYLFPAIAGWPDEERLVLHLLEHGVLVHPGFFYSYEHGAHLMISCLVAESQLREGLARLLGGIAHP
jgi:alanine-synthesizing transaminase